MTEIGKTFRTLHEQDGAFVIPNPWDIGSARILEAMGFRALATTSAGMAHARGMCDGVVPREEVLCHCGDVVRATSLPVSADLEKGFGDSPEDVFETIIAAAECGLAGCSIEDHTGDSGAPIFDSALAVERIAAACEARDQLPGDFVLTARCENLLWGKNDLEAVIRQLQAYDEAGADVLFAPGLEDLESIREVCAAVSKPVNVILESGATPFSVQQVSDAGARRISVGWALTALAYGSLIDAGRSMLENGSFDFLANVPDYDSINDIFKRADSA
ncbi:MAG: isocitrate lyase/PEP mutase family protein [Hyphomicrobiaceae bacterium]